MKTRFLSLCLVLTLLVGCAFNSVWKIEPEVALDAPSTDLTIPLGTPIVVHAHSIFVDETDGIRMDLMYSDGDHTFSQPMNVLLQDTENVLWVGDTQWLAPQPGEYELYVVLTTPQENAESEHVEVTVLAGPPSATLTPAAIPPSPLLTLTADKTSLIAGECTYLRWSVANLQPQSIDLNGQPVPPQGEMQICPCQTMTYDLIVFAGDKYAQSVTVQVSGSCAMPTVTPIPAPVIQFWADTNPLKAGSCTFLHWAVSNASQVFLNGNQTAQTGQQQVCLCSSTTYVLDVIGQDGNKYQQTRTIDVSGSCVTPPPPQDTTPPPVPTPLSPGNLDPNTTPVTAYCPLTLRWQAVSDPSGVTYSVILQEKAPNGEWTTVGSWDNLTTAQKDIHGVAECDYSAHRWQVRARDGAGNWSNWSSWMYYVSPVP